MILVTGASGTLGSALTARLVAQGEKVRALVLPSDRAARLQHLSGQYVRCDGDLTDPPSVEAATEGVTTVIHAAAIVPFSNALRAKMQAVNAQGTKVLLDAAIAHGVRDFLHVSSVSTFGLPDQNEIFDETADGWNGPSGYAYVDTKRAAEAHVAAASDRIRAVTVNPGIIFAGDGTDPFSWASLIRLVAERRLAFNLPGGACVVGEQDVVDGVIAAWRNGISGRRYILGTANTTYVELFAEVTRQARIAPLRASVPAIALHALGAFNSLRNWLADDPLRAGPLNRENAALLSRRLYYSSERARREIGFKPGPLATVVADVLGAIGRPARAP